MMDRSDKTAIRIHVHPDDLVWLESLKLAEEADYLFLANSEITPGGCRLEGELGEVDAELETRIKLSIEQFRDHLLDDPGYAPEPDLTPLYDSESLPDGTSVRRKEPIAEKQASERVAPSQGSSSDESRTGSSFTFSPGANAADGLGAWGSLGQ